MTKRLTHKKHRFSKKSRHTKKKHRSSKHRSSKHRSIKHKGLFFIRNKKYNGGSSDAYPNVIGINEYGSNLYPISKYGVPGGAFDPPKIANGPNGNGPFSYPDDGPYTGAYTGTFKGYDKGVYSGGRRNKNKNKMRGGGGNQTTLLPQPLVDFGRSLTSGVQETINGFSGVTNHASLKVMPYDQPLMDQSKYIRTNFPNVAEDYNKADNYVSTL